MLLEGVDSEGNASFVGVRKGKLQTDAVATSDTIDAVKAGRAFQFYTRLINLTSAAKQIVAFVENDNSAPMVVTAVTPTSSESTGGITNQILIEQVGNIRDADDIITNAIPLTVTNRNQGSPAKFSGRTFAGPATPSGNELSAGGALVDLTTPSTFSFTTIIPRGGAVAVAVTPPTGNTSMSFYLSMSAHLLDS